MKSQTRNLNPTPEAVACMWLHSDSYSQQRGGSMDFYDARAPSEKANCERMVAEIIEAAKKHGKI